MDHKTFKAVAEAAYGKHSITEIAVILNVTPRAVRYWMAGQRTLPATLKEEMLGILRARECEITRAIHQLRKA